MLATRGDALPEGPDWTHEVKWDGMRVLAEGDGTRVRLTSRTERDVSVSFPELGELAGRDLLVDGEIVSMVRGAPSFGALQERIHVRKAARARLLANTAPVTYVVFDLLRLRGRDLSAQPLSVRRNELRGLALSDENCAVPEGYDDGAMLMQATREQGLEGVVSKHLDSRYVFGHRSRGWLKFPHRARDSYVVGGWRPETDSGPCGSRIGAILVGEQVGAQVHYRGRVGSGIAGRRAGVLRELLGPLTRATSPFAEPVPGVDARGTVWVEPVLVVEVESLGLSSQGRLRQPSYQGVRAE